MRQVIALRCSFHELSPKDRGCDLLGPTESERIRKPDRRGPGWLGLCDAKPVLLEAVGVLARVSLYALVDGIDEQGFLRPTRRASRRHWLGPRAVLVLRRPGWSRERCRTGIAADDAG